MNSMMPKGVPLLRNRARNQGRSTTRSVVSFAGRSRRLSLALEILAARCAVLFVLNGGRA